MFFKKKRRIRNEENERLMTLIEDIKNHLSILNETMAKSVDPHHQIINDLKITEAKYMFLLREAKIRYAKSNGKN